MVSQEIVSTSTQSSPVKKMKTKPKIGIVGYKLGENSLGITLPYFEHFSLYGNVVVVTPTFLEVDETLDLLVIPGGPDIDPRRYNRAPSIFTQKPDVVREYFDEKMIPEYIEKGIPIFGICRGHQSLAASQGGILVQHMYHETNPSDDRGKLVHNNCFIDINSKTKGTTKTNSIHHQAVVRPPDNAIVVAWHTSNKSFKPYEIGDIIEALYYPDINCASVQFHPEEIPNSEEISDMLINRLLES